MQRAPDPDGSPLLGRACSSLRLGGLWRHPDFLKLWAGQTVSLFGSAVSGLAFSLTAVLVLDATPAQMGAIRAAQYLPFLLLGLFVGAWVDRLRRRPILILADAGRALLIGLVPAAALLGMLRIELLYVVARLVGVLTVFFDVAYLAYFPSLVPRDALTEGNNKLEVSRSFAGTAGPALTGALVQLVTAPVAMVVDAASFVVSAASVSLIRTPEPLPAAPARGRSVWRDVGEGLRIVGRHPVLRTLAGQIATVQLAGGINAALLVLYQTRELGFTPALLGVIVSVFSIVALLTAVALRPVTERLGQRRTLIGSLLLTGIGNVCVPLAGMVPAFAMPLLLVRSVLHGMASPSFNVASVGLRQVVTPERLQGRMSATIRFVGWGMLPISALAGGLLGERLGLLPALAIAAGISLVACLWPLLQLPRVIVPIVPIEPTEGPSAAVA
ncbi:MAG: MFS transporter [Chloroflexi bacterium]|nr:MFS transporter [Chloroflexota bacterium]